MSTDSSGNQANALSTVRAISADGRFVAFESFATNLVAGDTNGVYDAFIKDTVTGVTTRVSTDSSGNQATGGYSLVRAISADGRFVAFESAATNLVAGDTNGQQDAFIKDTLTGVTTRISTDSSGNQATGGTSFVTAISADGRFVAFNSFASNLVAGGTNGQRDAFIKDTLTGVTTRVSTDSSGNQATGGFGSYVSAISADGRFVAFESDATNLVAGDTNGERDAFLRDLTKIGINQMSGMLVSNRASASVTFNLVTSLQDELSIYESNLGSSQSRAATFVSQLYSQKDEFITAETRISSADIAAESSELIRKQILQRTGTALLAQANQQPRLALDLLSNI
jgi:flagellin-like hook-associated protein FlgL